MKLSECSQGDTVTVQTIHGTNILRKRLMELGLTSGVQVKIQRYAPLKDPMEIKVRTSHIGLRVDEAKLIEVIAN